MNRLFSLIQVVMMIFALSAFAQEETPSMHDMVPPPPLDDAFMKWMAGEWKGTTESVMGKSTDYMKCEMGMDGQFLLMTYEGKMEEGRTMVGMGAITINQEGKLVGYWIDSWRTMSEGHGMQEGDSSTMEWATEMGPYVRKTKKVDENTMVIHGVMKDPKGQEMNSETKLTRVMSKK